MSSLETTPRLNGESLLNTVFFGPPVPFDPLETVAAKRAVLEQLHRDSPQTVPQVAAARHVCRQHIWLLADTPAERRLAACADSPGH